MKTITLFIKGIIIGIGKIIPGVSGAVLAIILKVYDEGLNSIINFFKNPKQNILFLTQIGLGILVGIILFSNIINYTLTNYYVITMLFFIGLIIGGIPSILKEVDKKDYIYSLITIILFTIISITNINNNYLITNTYKDYLVFFLGGITEALGTVIPGLSSTALLLILGIYNTLITKISNISKLIIDLKILLPFTIGLIIGLILISKLIIYLLNKHKKKTYSIIIGLLISSIITLIIKTFIITPSLIELLIGLLLMILGIIISNILG